MKTKSPHEVVLFLLHFLLANKERLLKVLREESNKTILAFVWPLSPLATSARTTTAATSDQMLLIFHMIQRNRERSLKAAPIFKRSTYLQKQKIYPVTSKSR